MTQDNKKAKKVRTCITLEAEILGKIDGDRGLVPRSAYINAKLKEEKKGPDLNG